MASGRDDEAPSAGVVAGMRELLQFHSPDELRQLVTAVLDDLDVPDEASAGDSTGGPAPGANELHDPASAFSAHASSGDVPEADLPGSQSLVEVRSLVSRGADRQSLVDAVFARLLGPRGPWGGKERGVHILLSRVWEGIAAEYYRSKGGKTLNYKSSVRMALMESWKAADSLAASKSALARSSLPGAGRTSPTGGGAAAARAGSEFRSVFIQTKPQAPAAAPVPAAAVSGPAPAGAPAAGAGASADDPAAASAGDAPLTGPAPAQTSTASSSLAARSRAETAFDRWIGERRAKLAAADEEVRAAERRVRLGRDATAVLDFMAALRGVRALERALTDDMAARCRAAEGALAALAARPSP
ncbi:hypothetical protein FNF29_07973 [Cafeteria roenbergensis]|uniref:Uncharacterized protein n=1 Tax=Cafeteria roenbergensis TaxID=33653 RepID=A0A5A8C0P7_CAFRO|nr:hypothetical protein FNF29_07973 [Cafeteria roenbergensis]|eukprot:KAA0146566.1 hypothetical protein FNF29_07973 [Cafeteria roenbergensis]